MRLEFVGRATEFARLRKRLDLVAASASGTAVAIRGRRQVGKSRLVQDRGVDLAQVGLVWGPSDVVSAWR